VTHSIPNVVSQITDELKVAFTKPTHARIVTLLLGAIITLSRRSISNVLRVLGPLAGGHWSSYHRVLSTRRWWSWSAARVVARLVLQAFYPDSRETIFLAGDDTVDGHRGAKVYGKGCHRDAVRSSHSFIAFRWGHKWVVLCVLVHLPWSYRPWALPVLVALYVPTEEDKKQGRRHKTPSELMRQMLAVLIHWFPERKFVFAGDGGFGTHALASFAHRHRKHLTVVTRFYPDANLYAEPSRVRGQKTGRPRKRGRKLSAPQKVVARTRHRSRLTVDWYGGKTRRVEVVTGTGHWYRAGEGLVPLRWVYVHDLDGTHRDDYFFTTDLDSKPKQIIQTFTGRWSIEVMFAEMRAHLGLETTRGRSRNTVLRTAPCLFGAYTLIVLMYHRLSTRWQAIHGVQWIGKDTTTFSDVITAVRRWLWIEWVFETTCASVAFSKLPAPFRRTVLAAVTAAI